MPLFLTLLTLLANDVNSGRDALVLSTKFQCDISRAWRDAGTPDARLLALSTPVQGPEAMHGFYAVIDALETAKCD